MSYNDKESKCKMKFDFNYRTLKPDDNLPLEYSFEELRAKEYYRRYEVEERAEAKYKEEMRKLEEENRRLKEALSRKEQVEYREDNETANFTSCTATARYVDQTTVNLTNVTAFIGNTTSYQSKRKISTYGALEEKENEDWLSETIECKNKKPINDNQTMPTATPSILASSKPGSKSVFNLEGTPDETTQFSNKTFSANTKIRGLREEFKELFAQDKGANDSNIDLVDMDLNEDIAKKDVFGNHSVLELTNFHPHGSSTQFFKPKAETKPETPKETTETGLLNRNEISGSQNILPPLPQHLTSKVPSNDADKEKYDLIAKHSVDIIGKQSNNFHLRNEGGNNTLETEPITKTMSAMTANTCRMSKTLEWDSDFNKLDKTEESVSNKSAPHIDQSNCLKADANYSCSPTAWINANMSRSMCKDLNGSNKNEISEKKAPEEVLEEEEQHEEPTKPLLTRNKLEASYNSNYYKILWTSMNESIMNATAKLEESKLSQVEEEADETKVQSIIDDSVTAGIGGGEKQDEEDEEDTDSDKTTTENNSGSSNTESTSSTSFTNMIDSSTCPTSSGPSALSETIMIAMREPFDFEVRDRLLARGPINELKKMPNYTELKGANAPKIRKGHTLPFKAGKILNIIDEIDKGSYAKIYLVEDQKKTKLALKVDCKPVPWELYITETLNERLKKLIQEKKMLVNVMESYVRMHEFLRYKDSCFSTMDYYHRGNLLNLVNYHIKTNEVFPYWFVLYLTLEMLMIIQYLHKCGIIHTDIKPDNLLINQLPDSLDYFDPSRTKCLVLIDFNRSIDMNLMPDETEFIGSKSVNKSLLCCEMKDDKPWTYQVDLYGILTCIHCIIFKGFMSVFTEKDRCGMTKAFPRCYDKLFTQLFDVFLNIPSCDELPDLQNDWIGKFLVLFKNELAASFSKSKAYLKQLNETFQ